MMFDFDALDEIEAGLAALEVTCNDGPASSNTHVDEAKACIAGSEYIREASCRIRTSLAELHPELKAHLE